MVSTSGKVLILFTIEQGMDTDNGTYGQGPGILCCLVQTQFTDVYEHSWSFPISVEAPATSSEAQKLT